MQRGGYGSSRPAPVPIFNHRKRQRQAMFADPGSNNTSTASAPASNKVAVTDLMPVGGFHGGRPQTQLPNRTVANESYTPAPKQKCSGPSCEGRAMSGMSSSKATNSSHLQQQQNVGGPRRSYENRSNSSGPSSSYTRNTHNQTQLHQQTHNLATSSFNQKEQLYKQSQSRGGQNSSNIKGGNYQQNNIRGYNGPPIQPSNGNFGTNNTSFNSRPQNRGYGNSSNQQQNQGLANQQQNQGFTNQQQNQRYGPNNHLQNRGYGVNNNTTFHGTEMNYRGWGGAPPMTSPLLAATPPPPGSMFNNASSAHAGFDGQRFTTTTESNSKSTPKPQIRKTQKQFENKNKNQPSLRVLTVNLATILKSTFLSDHLGPHMFEVFGVLDSAVVTDKTGTGKEFVLRDETGTLQCVFYEIDRQLPRLIRGQWQRCVGTIERKTNRLKCVSARSARGEERQLAKASEEQTESVMTSVRRQASEQ